MLLRLENAYASMTQMARNQERSANNLANANTLGYQRHRVFVEVLNEYQDADQATRSDRLSVGYNDTGPGTLERTDNPLDVALGGEGFFAVQDETTGSTLYTRAGRFTLDERQQLRNQDGNLVLGENGPITFPDRGGPIEISRNGEINVGGEVVGALKIVTFEAPHLLERAEGAAYLPGQQQPAPAASARVQQGFVEQSNVNAVQEMTEMIEHFRMFEAQQRSLKTTDQMLSTVVRDLGRF